MEDIQGQQLLELLAEQNRKAKILSHLKQLDVDILSQEKRLSNLDYIVEMEHSDIEHLRSINLKSMYQKYLGDIEKELERENQEYLLAVLNFHSCEDRLFAMQYEKDFLNKELIRLLHIDKKVSQAINQREKSIRKSNPEIAEQLINIENNRAKAVAKITEIKEAIEFIQNSEGFVKKIEDYIKDILDWGKYSNTSAKISYAGKGKYSSYKKKRYVDNFRNDLSDMDNSLAVLQKELQDVSHRFQIDYSSSFVVLHNFLDLFYNHLITDWVVRKKIVSTKRALENIQDGLLRLEKMLKKEARDTETSLDDMNQVRFDLITNI